MGKNHTRHHQTSRLKLPGWDQRRLPGGVGRGGMGVPEKLSPEGLCPGDSEKGTDGGKLGGWGIKKRIN